MFSRFGENHGKLRGLQARLGIEPGTSSLQALTAESLGHWWGYCSCDKVFMLENYVDRYSFDVPKVQEQSIKYFGRLFNKIYDIESVSIFLFNACISF